VSFWLFKSEPDDLGLGRAGGAGAAGEAWDGVRNYQARNHMKAMKVGDRGFFYHSNASARSSASSR
jgi:predicted RNA-binding protein with PUA-like domain